MPQASTIPSAVAGVVYSTVKDLEGRSTSTSKIPLRASTAETIMSDSREQHMAEQPKVVHLMEEEEEEEEEEEQQELEEAEELSLEVTILEVTEQRKPSFVSFAAMSAGVQEDDPSTVNSAVLSLTWTETSETPL